LPARTCAEETVQALAKVAVSLASQDETVFEFTRAPVSMSVSMPAVFDPYPFVNPSLAVKMALNEKR
jgi:hypothetical protein